MTTYKLETLTNEFVTNYFESNAAMDVQTKTGTVYHVFKVRGKYQMFSQYCMNRRPLTKEMQKVFH